MSSGLSRTLPVHSLHRPYHARSTHSAFSGASSVGAAAGAVVVLGRLGGEVMVLCFCVVVVLGAVVTSSWHPQNRPGDSQVVLLVVLDFVVVSSPQPQNRPGVEHVVLMLSVVLDGVIVSSSHPQNRPGVKHVVLVEVGLEDVVVVVVVVEVGVVDVVVEETSSLQPNQPLNKVSEIPTQRQRRRGNSRSKTSASRCRRSCRHFGGLRASSGGRLVQATPPAPESPLAIIPVTQNNQITYGVLHVSVRVRVLLVDVLVLDVVVVSVPLLSYIFQFPQSLHSGVNLHSGTWSYFRMTSRITARILCVPMPTRQPLSPTVS